MIRLEFGSTGAFEISWFHGLSAGNICLPCRLAPEPRSGWADALPTFRGLVTGVGEASDTDAANTSCLCKFTDACALNKMRNAKPRKKVKETLVVISEDQRDFPMDRRFAGTRIRRLMGTSAPASGGGSVN